MICRTEQRSLRFRLLKANSGVEAYTVAESILRGPGTIQHWTTWRRDENGQEWSFSVCLKLRNDYQVNASLLRLYPWRTFALDVAVVRIGKRGEIATLSGTSSRDQAVMAIQRQVLTFPLTHMRVDFFTVYSET